MLKRRRDTKTKNNKIGEWGNQTTSHVGLKDKCAHVLDICNTKTKKPRAPSGTTARVTMAVPAEKMPNVAVYFVKQFIYFDVQYNQHSDWIKSKPMNRDYRREALFRVAVIAVPEAAKLIG